MVSLRTRKYRTSHPRAKSLLSVPPCLKVPTEMLICLDKLGRKTAQIVEDRFLYSGGTDCLVNFTAEFSASAPVVKQS